MFDLQKQPTFVIRAATEDDVTTHLVQGIRYAVLAADPHTYIQCAARDEPPHGFWLSYWNGTQGELFHALDTPLD